jgi:hypothetical protein
MKTLNLGRQINEARARLDKLMSLDGSTCEELKDRLRLVEQKIARFPFSHDDWLKERDELKGLVEMMETVYKHDRCCCR